MNKCDIGLIGLGVMGKSLAIIFQIKDSILQYTIEHQQEQTNS